MRFVGAAVPARPKKARRAKGTPPPMSGFRSPTPRRHSVISPALRFWDTRHDSPPACGLSNTRPKSRARRVYRTELAASREIPSWLKAKATTRSAGGTGSACSKNIVGRRPPYFSAPTSGAEFPAGDRFWDTRHDSPRLCGYRTRVPSRDPDLSLRDEIQNPKETAKAVAACVRLYTKHEDRCSPPLRMKTGIAGAERLRSISGVVSA